MFVGGRRITAAALRPGDVVRLGDSVLVFGRGRPASVEETEALGIVGRAPVLGELRHTIRRVAPSNLVVLSIGPTGSVVARALHGASRRAGPFVAINCAALPAPLVESLLFGHRRGAYTGATLDHEGAFVRAHGGTLFLDEVGELPLESQAKLLRALEDREVFPLGAPHPITVDVRIVAATNVDLLAAARAGRFREDLYARLAGLVVRTPPLAARREDILLLLRRFLERRGLGARPMSADFADALVRYSWPRNVRELAKFCERLSVLYAHAERWERSMLDEDMEAELSPAADASGDDEATEDEMEGGADGPLSCEELVSLLEKCQGNVSQVARLAGRNRKQVYRWMDQYALRRGTGR